MSDRTNQSAEILRIPNAVLELPEWEAKIDLIRRTVAAGATNDELELFFHQARRAGLDPLAKQIYYVKRKGKGVIQVGIDGLRLIADRTGKYAGSDDAAFDGYTERGYPAKAKVTVYKIVQGQRCPFAATARWDEYYPGEDQGFQWRKMPHAMLAKCFSEDTEVLTDQGFQFFGEVTGRILQVTSQGLEATDARPFSQAYSGPMVTLDSDDLNFCVTPNHDMVTTAGKIEAGAMFDQSRSRAKFRIPRLVTGSRKGLDLTTDQIRLTAAYIADGYDHNASDFAIKVSRTRKVALLRSLGVEPKRTSLRRVAGEEAWGAGRNVTSRADQTEFVWPREHVEWLCGKGKVIDTEALLSLSQNQARALVDAWIFFDGNTNKKSGVRRLFTSRPDHLRAFELACVIAGYSIGTPVARGGGGLSNKPNFIVSVSERDDIPVFRWGRDYHNLGTNNERRRTGLEITQNETGSVWCCTVPSGVIVVRRFGFSMLCGNCAEALALRKAFPADTSGLYLHEEMDQADRTDAITVEGRDVEEAPKSTPAAPHVSQGEKERNARLFKSRVWKPTDDQFRDFVDYCEKENANWAQVLLEAEDAGCRSHAQIMRYAVDGEKPTRDQPQTPDGKNAFGYIPVRWPLPKMFSDPMTPYQAEMIRTKAAERSLPEDRVAMVKRMVLEAYGLQDDASKAAASLYIDFLINAGDDDISKAEVAAEAAHQDEPLDLE